MISVGVRDLENQLTQYLDAVKSGERVLITEHDQVVAEISLPENEVSNINLEEKLQLMSASGKLIRAKRNKSYQKKEESLQELDWISEYQENRYSYMLGYFDKGMLSLARLFKIKTNILPEEYLI